MFETKNEKIGLKKNNELKTTNQSSQISSFKNKKEEKVKVKREIKEKYGNDQRTKLIENKNQLQRTLNLQKMDVLEKMEEEEENLEAQYDNDV